MHISERLINFEIINIISYELDVKSNNFSKSWKNLQLYFSINIFLTAQCSCLKMLVSKQVCMSVCLYSVMQSDGNSISGDGVLDNFNRAHLDEFNILHQIYKSKYVRTIFMMILILYNIIQKCLLTQQ